MITIHRFKKPFKGIKTHIEIRNTQISDLKLHFETFEVLNQNRNPYKMTFSLKFQINLLIVFVDCCLTYKLAKRLKPIDRSKFQTLKFNRVDNRIVKRI